VSNPAPASLSKKELRKKLWRKPLLTANKLEKIQKNKTKHFSNNKINKMQKCEKNENRGRLLLFIKEL
jgi:hypothetical protein